MARRAGRLRYTVSTSPVRPFFFTMRLVLSLVTLVAAGLITPHSTHARFARDGETLSRASVLSGHAGMVAALHWLRRQSDVRAAGFGRDGRTLDIRFSDGSNSLILPSFDSRAAVGQPRAYARQKSHDTTRSGRALVLEPFASELSLSDAAGESEASALRATGFSVDLLRDNAVTVDTMGGLSGYAVVYMLTHSGVNAAGEGVIATGQLANEDPAMQPYLDDHSVMVVGISGSDLKYYGVLSTFFRTHEGDFAPDSLLFVNGCSFLRAHRVWDALTSRGVATMVSWDNDALSTDDTAAADLFFRAMAGGGSVLAALADVYNAGHGRSVVDGTVAQLGYVGDATLTLHDALDGPPTATPSPAASPTAAPSATPMPRPTATPVHTAIRHAWTRPLPLATALAAASAP